MGRPNNRRVGAALPSSCRVGYPRYAPDEVTAPNRPSRRPLAQEAPLVGPQCLARPLSAHRYPFRLSTTRQSAPGL